MKPKKEGEAINNSSGEESLYEIHIQSMIRRAGPGAIKSHLKLDFLSECSLKFEERSSALLARYWNDVKTVVSKTCWTKLRVRMNTLSKPIFVR